MRHSILPSILTFASPSNQKPLKKHHIIELRSNIYKNHAFDTPLPFGDYNDAKFKHLSEKQTNYVTEAVQQTVDAFVKAITMAQI